MSVNSFTSGNSKQLTTKHIITVAVICFVLISAHLFLLVDSKLLGNFQESLAQHSSMTLNSVLGEQTEVTVVYSKLDRKRIVAHDGPQIVIPDGGGDIIVLAVLLAFIAGWPASVLARVIGLTGALLYFYLVDVARICTLMEIEIHNPTRFDFLNNWVVSTGFTLLMGVYFLLWHFLSSRATKK